MIPKDKVITLNTKETIGTALKLMAELGISAVVVTGEYEDEPVGILTNTDLVAAYHKNVPPTEPICSILPGRGDYKYGKHHSSYQLDTLLDTDNRDTAARMLHECGRHHAVVVNAQGHFVGLVSAADVVREVARDAAAWPYPRTDDGMVHPLTTVKHKPQQQSNSAAAAVP